MSWDPCGPGSGQLLGTWAWPPPGSVVRRLRGRLEGQQSAFTSAGTRHAAVDPGRQASLWNLVTATSHPGQALLPPGPWSSRASLLERYMLSSISQMRKEPWSGGHAPGPPSVLRTEAHTLLSFHLGPRGCSSVFSVALPASAPREPGVAQHPARENRHLTSIHPWAPGLDSGTTGCLEKHWLWSCPLARQMPAGARSAPGAQRPVGPAESDSSPTLFPARLQPRGCSVAACEKCTPVSGGTFTSMKQLQCCLSNTLQQCPQGTPGWA